MAIEAAPGVSGEQPKVYEAPPEPAVRSGQVAFKLGDNVTFHDPKGLAQIGMIKRIKRRTATLGTTDGKTWRVHFQLLRHVVEV